MNAHTDKAEKGKREEGGLGWRGYALLGVWSLAFALVDAFFWFRVHWAAGLAFALVAPLALPFLLPRGAMRLLIALYLVWAVAWLSGTYLQGLLAESAGQVLARNRALAWFLGSYEMQVVCAAVAGLILGVVTVGVPLLLLAWAAAEGVLALNELPDVSRGEAVRLVLTPLLNVGPPWLVIDEGKEKTSKPEGLLKKLGGPGYVTVQEGNVAIVQKGGDIPKVLEPGKRHEVKLQERIRRVLDLRPQWENRTLENVRTRDHIPLTVDLGVGFGIELKDETDERIGAPQAPEGEAGEGKDGPAVLGQVYQVYESTVYKAAFKPAGDWRQVALGMVEATLRDVVATYDFDQLFGHEPEQEGTGGLDPDARTVKQIEEKVLALLKAKVAEEFGIAIRTVDIRAVSVPEAVQERLLEWWGARWHKATERIRAEAEKEALILKGEGQAQAMKVVEDGRVAAIADTFRSLQGLLQTVAQRDAELAQRLTAVMERLIEGMMTDYVLAFRMLEALERLSEGGGEVKVYLAGEGTPFLSPPEGQRREPE